MDRIKAFVEEHKVATIVAIFVFIIFIGFSVVSAMNVAQRREQEQLHQRHEQKKEEGSSTEETVPLSDTQKKLIEDYDAKTTMLIDVLSRGVWTANNGKNTVVFHDTYFTETDGKDVANHPYAISAVEYDNNGVDTEVDTIALETDTGTHLITYTSVLSAESPEAGVSSLTSATLFRLQDAAYSRTDTVIEVSITGLNEEMTSLLGNPKDLVAELSKWCSVHYPATTTAAWIGTATIDWNKNIVVTSFSLGGKEGETGDGTGTAATVVSVTYNSDAGTYEFSS